MASALILYRIFRAPSEMGICCILRSQGNIGNVRSFWKIWTFHHRSKDIIACHISYLWLIQLCKIPTQVHDEKGKDRIDERGNRKPLKSYIAVNPMLPECSTTSNSNGTTAPSWGRSSDLFINCSPLRVLPPAAALNRAPGFPSCHCKQAARHASSGSSGCARPPARLRHGGSHPAAAHVPLVHGAHLSDCLCFPLCADSRWDSQLCYVRGR